MDESTPAAGRGRWRPPPLELMQGLLPAYAFDSLLGAGGMGAVYKAVQTSLDRTVAIKVLPGDLLDDEDANFVERFKNEARTMARMNHPNIVNVFDFGETSTGLLYFVMEYVDGTDVAQMISSQGRLPEDHALAITAHVCDALAYAHARGVVHRDIKPANILINREGEIKVADFGLAKQHDAAGAGLTKSNMAMGTPDFVAPEALVSGLNVDSRADIYAVGVMLYNMLTGEIPRGRWLMPGEKLGSDPRFDDIIAKAMESDRDERYQSATEIRSALDQILTVPLPREPGVTGPKAPVPPAPRKQSIAPLAVTAAILVCAVGGFLVWNRGPAAPVIVEPVGDPLSAKPTVTEPQPEEAPKQSAAAIPVPGPDPPTDPVEVVASRTSEPAPPAPANPVPLPAKAPAGATRGSARTNSLGMELVPVPGTRVLMSVYETRRQDYSAYAAENEGVDPAWKSPRYGGVDLPTGDDHPVTMISWEDAGAFCRWLAAKENLAFRLPTVREWLLAVAGEVEEPGAKSESDLLALLDTQFPWGDLKPGEAGNYRGSEDPYDLTAPVGSFQANRNGFHDLGGNVWEWCTSENGQAAMLGCGYLNYGPFRKSTARMFPAPDLRLPQSGEGLVAGFRIVLAPEEIPVKPEAPAPPDPVTRRLTELEKTYHDTYEERIGKGHRIAVAELNEKYGAALDRSLAAASSGGKLEEALALRTEKDLIGSTGMLPETDDDTTPESLKSLRKTWRTQMAALLEKRDASPAARELDAAYERALAAYQNELTRAQDLDGALRVKAVRERGTHPSAPMAPAASPTAAAGAPLTAPAPLAAADVLPTPTPASQEEIRKLCEWVLQKDGTVDLHDDGSRQTFKKGQALPKGNLTPVKISVYELSFKRENSEREWFTLMGRVPSLEELAFTKNPGTMPIEDLRGLVNLRSLSLAVETVDDAAFAHLTGLEKLEVLKIGGYGIKQFTGNGLAYIAPGLVEFYTNSPTLTAEGLAQLARFKKLQKLTVSGNNFAEPSTTLMDAALAGLASMPDLEALYVPELVVDGSFLDFLPANSKLKWLDLYGIPTFKAENHRHLAKLKLLEHLDHPATDPGPEGMTILAGLPSLKEFYLHEIPGFTGEAFRGVKGFRALERLGTGSCPTSDAGFDAIASALPDLKSLSFGNAESYQVTVTPEGFSRAIARFKNLDNLQINGERTTDAYLPAIAQLEKIDYLMLTYARISDEGLRPLMKLPLGYLRLDGTPVTDAVIPILQTCPTLQNVPVGGTKMTEAGKAKLTDWLRNH